MTDASRLDTVRETLDARGYRIDETPDGRTIARPTETTDRIGVPGVLSVRPAPAEPAAVLRTIGTATAHDRTALFVAHPDDASTLREILTAPPGLVARTDRSRQFYTAADRFRLGDAGIACCRADSEPTWHERQVDGLTGRTERFVLEGDNRTITAFDAIDSLVCPSPSAFEYVYSRDDEGRFQVRKLKTDRTVGRFASIRELKANAYQPIPVPLVPERIVDGYLPESWLIATVENGRVTALEGG